MLERDQNKHAYIRVENIRVTYIPAADRQPEADWAESDVIRVQSHKNATDNSLHMGAELPIACPDVFVQFIAAMCQVYIAGRQAIEPCADE